MTLSQSSNLGSTLFCQAKSSLDNFEITGLLNDDMKD